MDYITFSRADFLKKTTSTAFSKCINQFAKFILKDVDEGDAQDRLINVLYDIATTGMVKKSESQFLLSYMEQSYLEYDIMYHKEDGNRYRVIRFSMGLQMITEFDYREV